MTSYPIVFDASSGKGTAGSGSSKQAGGDGGPFPYGRHVGLGFSNIPLVFSVVLEAPNGSECHRFQLAEIRGWPETKTEMEPKCTTVFKHKICTKIPVVYVRKCKLLLFVDVCYPNGGLNDVQTCIEGAALASAVAAVISEGSVAAPAFKAALEACLTAKAIDWANQVTVNVGTDTECGDWHRV